MGNWGGLGGEAPGIGHGVQGDPGDGATCLQVHGVQGRSGGCPRFGRLG